MPTLRSALSEFGGNGVLKTCRLGYDGKGQRVFRDFGGDVDGTFAAMGGVPLILESHRLLRARDLRHRRARQGWIARRLRSGGECPPRRHPAHIHGSGRRLAGNGRDRLPQRLRHPRGARLCRRRRRRVLRPRQTARCSSTRSRRASTIPATGRRPPAPSRSSSSTSAPLPACRSATRRAIPTA